MKKCPSGRSGSALSAQITNITSADVRATVTSQSKPQVLCAPSAIGGASEFGDLRPPRNQPPGWKCTLGRSIILVVFPLFSYVCAHPIDLPSSDITARCIAPASFRVTCRAERVRTMVQAENTNFRDKNALRWRMKYRACDEVSKTGGLSAVEICPSRQLIEQWGM